MLSIDTGFAVVWANSTGSTNFFPLTRPVLARDAQPVFCQRYLENATDGNLQVQAVAQFSNDGGKTWGNDAAITSSFDGTAGWVSSANFTNVSNPGTSARRLVRFGVYAKKSSGTTLAYGRVRLLIDAREG